MMGCLLLVFLAACAESAAPGPTIPLSNTPPAKDPGKAMPGLVEGMDGNVTQAPELEETPPATQPAAAGKTIREPTLGALPADPLARKLIGRASSDLAKRLSVDVKDIQLLGVLPVVWPDASLGCPAPDQVYQLTRIPGYRIMLSAGGQVYFYHTDSKGTLILCTIETDLPYPEFPVNPEDIQDGKPWLPVE